jgi:dGTPase
LRIVTKLERRYASFDGLNLTFETLEGLVKHNGPLLEPDGSPIPRYAKRGLPVALLEYNDTQNLDLASFASAEAQAAALADDIAYNAHDIDDGLRAGLINVQQISDVDFLRDIGSEVEELHPRAEPAKVIHELVRRLITHFIEDAIEESQRRIETAGVTSLAGVRAQKEPLIAFSQATSSVDKIIKSFLIKNMYRHQKLTDIRVAAGEVILNLFPRFFEDPGLLPEEWSNAVRRAGADEGRRARLICDYIAGMTDRYALAEHKRLFDRAPELRYAR